MGFYHEALTDLPETDVRKIMYENGKRFVLGGVQSRAPAAAKQAVRAW